MSPFEYKTFETITIGEIAVLRQAYQRLKFEGYNPGFSWDDFFDIVLGRGDHEFNEFREADLLERASA